MFLMCGYKLPVILITIASIFMGLFAVAPVFVQAQGKITSSIYEQTNMYRKTHGLEPLVADTTLEDAARAKAHHMFDNQYWSHNAPSGETPWDFMKAEEYAYVRAGENLAHGFSNSKKLFAAWTQSPGHNANLVGDYSHIGVASVDGVLLGEETTLVVALYAVPKSEMPQENARTVAATEESLDNFNPTFSTGLVVMHLGVLPSLHPRRK